VLLESYRIIAEAIQTQQVIAPAAEWLVDNFHIVEDQVREIREDLPAGYYRKLPKLASGHLAGTRASSVWPGRSSRTPTAASTPTSCCAS
jgi:hypothetical protein